MVQAAEMLESALASLNAGDAERADRICLDILDGDARHSGALHLLGRIRARRNDPAAAVEWFQRAVAASPEKASYRLSLAASLALSDQWAEAEPAYREVLRLDPANVRAHSELALVLRRLGRLEEAVSVLEGMVRLQPDDVTSHLFLFAALHRAGHLERGWAEYEWRTRDDKYRRDFAAPLWDGSPLEGKTLLVLAEQGLGDQIHFIRYAPMARERGAGRVVVQCANRARRLIETCPGVDEVVAFGSELPPFDAYVWSGSLPGLMGTGPETIPARVPYLSADPERVARWQEVMAPYRENLLVGINWEGNRSNLAGQDRAIPLESFFPLARMDGVILFSLQKGEGRDQLENVPPDMPLPDLGKHFGELASAAAAMETLDLIITNDTSLSHLAGALGRPVWMILPPEPCWRWTDYREDSPWYPTMRIFRQSWSDEGWGAVFGRIERELGVLAAARAANRTAAPAAAECAGGD